LENSHIEKFRPPPARYKEIAQKTFAAWHEKGFLSFVDDKSDKKSIRKFEVKGLVNMTYAEQKNKVRVCVNSFAINKKQNLSNR